MKDREEIIKALRLCAEATDGNCRKCPYDKGSAQCITYMQRDVLALIEGREEEEP